LTVTALFKARGTSREVKMKSVEFLYFYLMPETPVRAMGGSVVGGSAMSGSLSGESGYGSTYGSSYGSVIRGKSRSDTKSTEEKQAMLGRHLSNVEDLVEDLRESTTFGGSVF
jgi:Cell division control protein 14, SIN component